MVCYFMYIMIIVIFYKPQGLREVIVKICASYLKMIENKADVSFMIFCNVLLVYVLAGNKS